MFNDSYYLNDAYKSLNLLCVEDDENISEIYKAFFSETFNNVFFATNGEEGLNCFKEEHVDIIITDHMMPLKDGLNMSRDIREIDSTIPIILVTALENVDILKEALKIQVTSFLQKPFTKKSLFNVFNASVKSVLIDRVIQQERKITIDTLRKCIDYNLYQEKLSFEKEKTIAQNDLQNNEETSNYSCNVYYKPLDILSGDSYVIRKINDNENFLLLIDGMGKGISASVSAMISSACVNYYINSMLVNNEKFDFKKFLEYFFMFIQPILLEAEVISAHFILHNHAQQTMHYSIFSMPAILYISDEDKLEKISSNNPPLNKYEKTFNIDKIDLKNVKKMLIYSDGLCENSVDNHEHAYSYYLNEHFLNAHDSNSFQDFIDSYIKFQEDDITYIYLQDKYKV